MTLPFQSPSLLPELYCPFPSALHARAQEAQTATLSWAERFGLVRDDAVRARIAATRTSRLAGRVGPDSTLRGLMLSTDWQTWLCLFDDAFCDETELDDGPAETIALVTRLLIVLETGAPPAGDPDRFLAALADLLGRLGELATPTQFARFRTDVKEYLFALTWEAAQRAKHVPAPLEEYVIMRRHSGAVPPCLALIDVVNGFELPDSTWNLPCLRAVSDATADLVCWSNDILSYLKEVKRSAQVLSLPAVLANERGLSTEQALAEAARRYNARFGEYQQLESEVLGGVGPLADRYVADLRHWIAGNLAWSYETGRYQL